MLLEQIEVFHDAFPLQRWRDMLIPAHHGRNGRRDNGLTVPETRTIISKFGGARIYWYNRFQIMQHMLITRRYAASAVKVAAIRHTIRIFLL